MKFPDTFRTKVVVFAGAALLGSGAALESRRGMPDQV